MKINHKIIEFTSKEAVDFYDLTDEVEKEVTSFKIKNGSVLVYSMHTTLAICINEREKGFFEDFKDFLGKYLPKDAYWRHNDLNIRTENLVCEAGASDCLNGHSHCSQLLMRTSETIPIIEGKLMLGTWQRIFAIELDCCRKRKVIIQVTGND